MRWLSGLPVLLATASGAHSDTDAAALVQAFTVPRRSYQGRPIEEIDGSPGNAVLSPLERETGLVTENVGEDQVQESLRSLAHKYATPTRPPTPEGFPFYKAMQTPMGLVGPQGSPWGVPMGGGWGLYEFNPTEVAAAILNQNSGSAAEAMDGVPELRRKTGQWPETEAPSEYGEDPFSSGAGPYDDMPADLQPYMEKENMTNPFDDWKTAFSPGEIVNDLLSPEHIESVIHHPKAGGGKALYEVIKSKMKSTKLGNMLINSEDMVQSCADIDASIQCTVAEKLFNFTCRGWGGSTCLSMEAQCEEITDENLCAMSKKFYKLDCLGWSGSTCMSRDFGRCADITRQEFCGSSKLMYGLDCRGWTGSSCLGMEDNTTDFCSQITERSWCNKASSKFGLECRGWGGSACLGNASTAEEITTKHLCEKSLSLFGVPSLGWGGSQCLPVENATCSMITAKHICDQSYVKLGIRCWGWSGSECLGSESAANLISDPDICNHAKRRYKSKTVMGWGGSSCITNETMNCSLITARHLCENSQRLNMSCAGWGGSSCLDLGADASEITLPHICRNSSNLLGIESRGWDGTKCLSITMNCTDITTASMCRNAHKMGLQCVGWGGSVCLNPNDTASAITSRHKCEESERLFNIKSRGWAGDRCIGEDEDIECADITSEPLCYQAKQKLGLDCRGWSGARCLAWNAGPEDIESASVCESAKSRLRMDVRGWGGTHCLKMDSSCHDITTPGICNDALRRLKLKCEGWGGAACLTKRARCEDITSEYICRSANDRFKFMNCSHWDSFEGKCVSQQRL